MVAERRSPWDVAVRWADFRGSTMFGAGEQIGEFVTLIEFDCPGDERMRMGIWFGPAEEVREADATENDDAAGTAPAAEAIVTFVQPIRPCGASPSDGG